jgi:hypothetical protein
MITTGGAAGVAGFAPGFRFAAGAAFAGAGFAGFWASAGESAAKGSATNPIRIHNLSLGRVM